MKHSRVSVTLTYHYHDEHDNIVDEHTLRISDLSQASDRCHSRFDASVRCIELIGLVAPDPAPRMSNPLLFGASAR